MKRTLVILLVLAAISGGLSLRLPFATTEKVNEDSLYIARHYYKIERYIPMRDGVRLFTAIYIPRDSSKKFPVMLNRTPYSVAPYGENRTPGFLRPSMLFVKEGYIFAFQDVRGRMNSEGEFVNMRPHIPVKKNKKKDIDESTDTWDTIDWLIKNIKNNNGRVGMAGISYPGFYTAAGIIDHHPALKAASPQAPVSDWYIGDDFHHHGAFFLPHAFNFLARFGVPRPKPITEFPPAFRHGTPDGYHFFMELGPLRNVNAKYFRDSIAFWNDIVAHPNYDDFWKARNINPHLKNIKCAVLTVGGWFDAENLYGALHVYQSIEKNNPAIRNMLVMGPWRHGGWARDSGHYLGNAFFGTEPYSSLFFREKIELAFFNHYLKDYPDPRLPEAYVFETRTNQWRKFETWPPKNTVVQHFHFGKGGLLSTSLPSDSSAYEQFVSDPFRPVPYTEVTAIGMTKEYMTDDQRFASRRPDVLVFQTDVLKDDITLAGPIMANLKVSTTGTDADWIVKIIDVYPHDQENFPTTPAHIEMAGYQQLVRGEVFRGRFRNGYEIPMAFLPRQVTDINFELQDVFHTFKKGHRIMIHVQSTWFPLVDRNPQHFVENIFMADETDFQAQVHKVYCGRENGSFISARVLK